MIQQPRRPAADGLHRPRRRAPAGPGHGGGLRAQGGGHHARRWTVVGVWNTYSILAQIAERQGDAAAARDWRRREQETFAAFPGSWANLERQFGPVVQAAAAAAQGVPGAREAVEAAFEPMTKGGYMVADPIRRIWAGERDVWALTEGMDRNNALIVRKVLEALAGRGESGGGGWRVERGEGASF